MSAWRGHKEDCVQWIENTIHLPLGLSAEPAQIKLPIYLPECGGNGIGVRLGITRCGARADRIPGRR
jgi:hypothetical protein